LLVRVDDLEGTSPLSRELARLDNDGFGNRLAEYLREMFPAEMAAILDALGVAVPPATTRTRSPRKRRRKTERKITPISPKQAEAVQLVAEHKGNIAAAARAAGKSRAAMQNLYDKAMKKLGKKAIEHATQALPTDKRGQVSIPEDEE
jgi:predicted DNA-binding protein (UPF0251 family)